MSGLLTAEDILRCKGHVVAIDTETNGLRWWENNMIGVGIYCPTAGVQGYADTCTFEQRPFGKTRLEFQGKMDYSKSKRGKQVKERYQPTALTAIPQDIRIRHFCAAVQEIANDPNTTLIGHNLKFDLHFMGLRAWELPCRLIDTTVMVHLYDSRMFKSLAIVEEYFLGRKSKRQHIQKAEKKYSKMAWLWGPEVLADYCTNDCIVTYQLCEVIMPELRKRKLMSLFALQMRYLRLLQKMEHHGIRIASVFCHEATVEFEENVVTLEKALFDTVGYEFNWRSNTQLSKAIYEDLGIEKPTNPYGEEDRFDVQHFRAAKLYTESATSSPLLIKINHPLKGTILALREAVKLATYAQTYIDLQDKEGILHASFNQTKTITGRLSSSDPNLQNLPSEKRKVDVEAIVAGGTIRTGGYNLRQALIARPGYKMVSIDHKQQEMRLLAILSQEPIMLEAMRNREDIHLRVAIAVWGDCGEALNKIHREWSKAISFGLIYGLSENSLQEYFGKMGVEADANTVKTQYFEVFPGLQPWFQEVISYVKDWGYVQYWSNRYWFADNLSEGYKGINALIQGGCADFISVVALRVDSVLARQGWGHILSIIHDEILLEIREDVLDEALPVLARAMEGEDIFDIPFATDVEVGDSYGTLSGYSLQRDPSEIDWRDYA